MPTYTYKCEKCDLVFEHFHAMSETLEHCVTCNPPAPVKGCPPRHPISRKIIIFQNKSREKLLKNIYET